MSIKRFFIDTEFIEDGETIDPISIGVVGEGIEFYAEFLECDLSHANSWVKQRVIPKLSGVKTSTADIGKALINIFGVDPEIWGYYSSYDWVVVCQIYGKMIDLPKGWPKHCLDVKQKRMEMGNPRLPEAPIGEHNALDDARWVRDAYLFLENLKNGK